MENFRKRLKILSFVGVLFLFSLNAFSQDRIVGGVDASISDYPWQVALTSPFGYGFCGGSIINDSWVLTAAHCVSGESSSSLYIRAGASGTYAEGGDSYSVSQIISHPNYFGNSNDIALVQINGQFNFGTNVQAIDLISEEEITFGAQDAGVTATTTGWGALYSGGPSPNILQTVDLPIVANNVACGSSSDSNGNSGYYSCSELDESMICAGVLGVGGQDACQGDSGGPLVVRNSADNGWLLIGATSWGYGCADGNYPGVWAKVSHFLTWISSYTGDSGNDNNDVNTGCGDDEFTCDNGECISASYYNDGASECGTASWPADCSDGSDEPCLWENDDNSGDDLGDDEPSDCEATCSNSWWWRLDGRSIMVNK